MKCDEWEVEIWFLKDISEYRNEIEVFKELINIENRKEILLKKEYRNKNKIDKITMNSYKIYSEILKLDK